MAHQIVEVIRTICRGKRYLKCHLELIYQFIKTKANKILASSLLSPDQQNVHLNPPAREGFGLIDYCMSLLTAIIEQQCEFLV